MVVNGSSAADEGAPVSPKRATPPAKGGGNGFNLENGTYTLKLGGDTPLTLAGQPNISNYIDIANFVNGPVTANITGFGVHDYIGFQGVECDYNIVKTTNAAGQKITTVTANQSEGGFAASRL